jgi:hypothetical protein
MATRCFIGVELPEGKVKAVYCHNDGYPEGVGADLLSMGFTEPSEVEEFVNEGDRSTVDLSYKEWRNEDCPPNEYESVSEYFNSDLEQYGYLFTQEGQWLVKDMHAVFPEPRVLEEIL